jgi:hypothetical protein
MSRVCWLFNRVEDSQPKRHSADLRGPQALRANIHHQSEFTVDAVVASIVNDFRREHYLPPRANWNPSDQTLPTNSSNNSRGLSPIQDSPVELPAQLSTVGAPRNERSSEYYEDVDPRFAEPMNHAAPPAPMPASLMPGGLHPNSLNPNFNSSNQSLNSTDQYAMRNSSFEDIPDGARSPAASEASHFTSVSQRGVNPNWRPPPGPPMPGPMSGPYNGYGPRQPPRQEDAILQANAANPDFAIPGAGFGRGRGRGRERGGGRGGAPPPPATMANMGLGNQGRYPGANAI